jgi:excisionase family DNA binding protein
MDSLLRAGDVARILNIRPSTVYDLAHRGILQHIRITQGSRRCLIRFRVSDIDQLLRERTLPAQDEPLQSASKQSQGTKSFHPRTKR